MSGEIKFMKILDGHLSKVQGIIKKVQKLDSFIDHYKQHNKPTASWTYLLKFMTLNVVKQIKLVRSILSLTKNNYNLCMEELLTILKNVCGKSHNYELKFGFVWGLL